MREQRTPRMMAPGMEGRPADGNPILPGDVFRMVSGRITTPFPKGKSEFLSVRWMRENAIAEAIADGSKWHERLFSQIDPQKASDADRYSLTLYLFSERAAAA